MKVPHTVSGQVGVVEHRVGESRSVASPQAFGAGVGKATQGLGQTVLSIGDQFEQQFEQTQRFATMERLADFQSNLEQEMQARAQTFDPSSGADFKTDISDLAAARRDEFQATVPIALQDEFSARANDIQNAATEKAYTFQIGAMSDFAKTSINQSLDDAKISLDQDGSVENLDAQRAKIDAMIDASPLTPAEKIAAKRVAYTGIESASYKSEVRNGHIDESAIGVGSAPAAGAAGLIADLDNIDKESAVELANDAEQTILAAVDPLVWSTLNTPEQAAVISLVADTGTLPDEVAAALSSGGDVAAAIEGLGGDRRKEEAAVARGDALLDSAKLEADPRYSNIPYEDRVALRADAEREATQAHNAAVQEQKARNDAAVNALAVGVYDGSAGQMDIDNLREAGVLTDYEDIKRIQDLLDKKTEDLNLAARGFQMIQDGKSFSPTSDDDKKTLNAMIGKSGLEALQNQDSAYGANVLQPLVRQTQVIPTDVAGLLSGMIRSNDMAKSEWAYDMLSQLQQVSPDAFHAQMDDTTEDNVALWSVAKQYYPPDQLQEILRGGDTQEQRVRTQALQEKARTLLSDKNLNVGGDVLSLMGVGGGFFGAGAVDQVVLPWASEALMADFNQLFTEEYSRVGDVTLAKGLAVNMLQKNWGQTSVGGGPPTLMKYPPEKVGYTPIDGSFNWMNTQAAEDLNLAPGETFQLISDEQTRSELDSARRGEGFAPSYGVVITGTDGVWRMLEPWAPMQANRIRFDSAPFVADQEVAWAKRRMQGAEDDNAFRLGMAGTFSNLTGVPIPSSLLPEGN